jgi:hypothetical protein
LPAVTFTPTDSAPLEEALPARLAKRARSCVSLAELLLPSSAQTSTRSIGDREIFAISVCGGNEPELPVTAAHRSGDPTSFVPKAARVPAKMNVAAH